MVVVALAGHAVPACEAAVLARLAVPASGAWAARVGAAFETWHAIAGAIAVARVFRRQGGLAVAEVAEEAIERKVPLVAARLASMPAAA